MKIVRAGRTVVDVPIQRLGCPDCRDRPADGGRVRDLDGGEPEVLVDLYTGGAHCCAVTLILRWDAAAQPVPLEARATGATTGRGSSTSTATGCPSSRPSTSGSSTRTRPTSFSAAPIRILSYRQGKLVDVTRRVPGADQEERCRTSADYLKGRPDKDVDVRAYVAAYVADEYLLGRPAEAKRVLDLALSAATSARARPTRLARGHRLRRRADARPEAVGVPQAIVSDTGPSSRCSPTRVRGSSG